MCSGGDTRALPRVGSPIRKSADQRLFSTSPRLIAAVHVLHRLLTPRHPPRALNILTRYSIEHTYCRYAVFKVRAPAWRPAPETRSDPPRRADPSRLNSMAARPAPRARRTPRVLSGARGRDVLRQVVDIVLGLRSPGPRGARGSSTVSRGTPEPRWRSAPLPRKEVIQPQLPLRLPCYDFTPIADPTFDGCPPCGLAHRLRVLPTFVV